MREREEKEKGKKREDKAGRTEQVAVKEVVTVQETATEKSMHKESLTGNEISVDKGGEMVIEQDGQQVQVQEVHIQPEKQAGVEEQAGVREQAQVEEQTQVEKQVEEQMEVEVEMQHVRKGEKEAELEKEKELRREQERQGEGEKAKEHEERGVEKEQENAQKQDENLLELVAETERLPMDSSRHTEGNTAMLWRHEQTQEAAQDHLPVIVVRTNGKQIMKENGAASISVSVDKRKRKAPMNNGHTGDSVSAASRKSSRLKAPNQDLPLEPVRRATRHSSLVSIRSILFNTAC